MGIFRPPGLQVLVCSKDGQGKGLFPSIRVGLGSETISPFEGVNHHVSLPLPNTPRINMEPNNKLS